MVGQNTDRGKTLHIWTLAYHLLYLLPVISIEDVFLAFFIYAGLIWEVWSNSLVKISLQSLRRVMVYQFNAQYEKNTI